MDNQPKFDGRFVGHSVYEAFVTTKCSKVVDMENVDIIKENTEALLHAEVSPCGICGGKSFTRTGFSQSPSVFPSQYLSTAAPYSPMSHLGDGHWTC
jgi:hypothetical protein